MSLRLQGPSLLLNSYAFTDCFGGCGMFMDTTWNCPRSSTAKDIVNWVAVACSNSGGRLANVVLNFHGKPGRVFVGEASPGYFPGIGRGANVEPTYHQIDNNSAGTFWALRNYQVGTIWFHSCNLAQGESGRNLCRQIAIASRCRVVAAEDTQEEWWASLNVLFMPRGCVDDFEGQVYLWDTKGNVGRFNPNGGNWS